MFRPSQKKSYGKTSRLFAHIYSRSMPDNYVICILQCERSKFYTVISFHQLNVGYGISAAVIAHEKCWCMLIFAMKIHIFNFLRYFDLDKHYQKNL